MIKRMSAFVGPLLESNDSLLKHSAIIFVCSMIANVLGYFFQLFMGRMLGPEGFGELGALFSIIYLFAALFTTLQTVITNFSSEYKAKKAYGKLHYLFLDFAKKLFLMGIFFVAIFWLFSGFIASYLHLSSRISIILLGVFILVSLIFLLYNGMITGLQRFYTLGSTISLNSFAKLVLGIILVKLGFSVSGAVGAIILATVCMIIILHLGIKDIFKAPKVKTEYFAESIKYMIPVFFATLSISLFSNVDLLLVKHYFPAKDAGFYAGAVLLGKIVLFATAALAAVLFPKVSELAAKKKNTSFLLRNTLGYTLLLCTGVVIFFFFFPKIIVSLLFGSEYKIAHLIAPYALAMSFYSLSNVFINYNLARKEWKFLYALIPLVVLQVIAVSILHSSLTQVVYTVVVLNLLACVSLAAYNFSSLRRFINL